MASPKCPECGREAIKKPIAVCGTCYREVAAKKFGSRAKGCSFELEVAKALSAWWGVEKSFRRTPLSGAWDPRAGGDLVAPDGFPFTVECKKVENWDLLQLITSGRRKGDEDAKCLIEKHWSQAVRECQPGKRPMLVFSRNHQPAFFMLLAVDWSHLEGVSDARTLVFMPCSAGDDRDGDDVRVIGLLSDLLEQWQAPAHEAM